MLAQRKAETPGVTPPTPATVARPHLTKKTPSEALSSFLRKNGEGGAIAILAVALGVFGLPYVPHSLCVTVGVVTYVMIAWHCDSLRLGLWMLCGPLLTGGLWLFWKTFDAIDNGNIEATAFFIGGDILLITGAFVGSIRAEAWQREHNPRPISKEPEARLPASVLAHSKFAERQIAEIADTEV